MTIKDLMTTYWSQFTLVLLAIGSLLFYFIKRHFDKSSKKIEINHSLFQQSRLKALTDFFTNYVRAETMWEQIAIWEILEKNIDAKEIDEIIFPVLNDLKRTLFDLKIYFKKEEYKLFEDLVNGIFSIKRKVSELYFDYNKEKNLVHKANEFSFHKDDILKTNSEIIDKICMIISDTYKT